MSKRQGFTLLETVVAVAIFSLVIAATMGSWMLFLHKSNRVNTQASLDMDVRRVVERFRSEIRNSARETIVFYPINANPYEAVGFAMPSDADGDGLMDMDASGSNILWRQQVVYHVWNHSPHQMRRTVFNNRYASASYAERYDQVAKVVTTGDGSAACLPGESSTTMVLFENLFTGKLWHAESRFDGYAPQVNTREPITFGSVPLGPGAHTVTFTLLDKNVKSTGYALSFDELSASVSGWPLEAELCAAGGASSSPVFVGQGVAGAAYGRKATTSAVGDSIKLEVLNDAIEECVFIGGARNVTFSNTVVRFDEDYTPTGFDAGVFAAKLDGQYKTAWWGSVQSSAGDVDETGRDALSTDLKYFAKTNCAVRIPIAGSYVTQDGYGPVFRMYKSAYNGNLKIFAPCFAETDTPDVPSINGSNDVFQALAFYQNGVKKAGWSDCAAGGVDLRPAVGDLKPIYAGQSFLFSYAMSVSTPNDDAIRAFRLSATCPWSCWRVPGGGGSMAAKSVWSAGDFEVLRGEDDDHFWKRCMPGLICMTANYAEEGDYVSHPFDTKDESGKTKSIQWEAEVPSGASLTVYARSGNTLTDDGFGISDAPAWENVGAAANGGAVSSGAGRYLQFRAFYTGQPARGYPAAGGAGSSGPYCSNTPRLRRVLFTWDGEERYVDIAANLLKGPDCGIFKVEVDGKEMVQGVTMEIEIFKDIRTQGGVQARVRSAMTAEVDPRNSDK